MQLVLARVHVVILYCTTALLYYCARLVCFCAGLLYHCARPLYFCTTLRVFHLTNDGSWGGCVQLPALDEVVEECVGPQGKATFIGHSYGSLVLAQVRFVLEH